MKPFLIVLSVIFLPHLVDGQNIGDDDAELKRLHKVIIDSHLNDDVESWMAIEADTVVSANGGRVTFPSSAQRRQMRISYVPDASYTSYRDVREPTVRISEDGSLGWLIAEVEVIGKSKNDDGSEEHFARVWAWIELYARTDNGWILIGNVSNSREI